MKTTSPWKHKSPTDRLEGLQQRVKGNDPAVESVFTQLFDREEARLIADTSHPSELSGALVSVKDLFDVAGYVTRAGTVFMQGDPPATDDADIVKRLRKVGAVMAGHTSMTELAYSGLGINPHYGTADNALYPGCIPGGSTAGGAVSVARELVDIALGTDTGGSLRIPAAFNGIVGFKPSQSTVSRRGCKPLSVSLDSVGMMAHRVATCQQVYQQIKRPEVSVSQLLEPSLLIPANYGMDDLQPEVVTNFQYAVEQLKKAGFVIEERSLKSLDALRSLAVWQFAAVECRAEYAEGYSRHASLIDPAVHSRMTRADEVDAVAYRQTLNQRVRLIHAFNKELENRVLLMPTVPILPPALSELEAPADYNRINLQVLRNTSIANVMDGCSISIPVNYGGHTTGLMLTAQGYSDTALLDLAKRCESHLV